jgi:hypothetical protein
MPNPSPIKVAFDDFVTAIRTHALNFEVEVHEEAAVAAVRDLVEKLKAIHEASGKPDPNAPPPLAKVVPLNELPTAADASPAEIQKVAEALSKE